MYTERAASEKTLSRWVSHTRTHAHTHTHEYVYNVRPSFTHKSYHIYNVYAIRFPPSHTYVSGELIARGGKSLSFVYIMCYVFVGMCVCVCVCASTGDGTGDKRIGHARGIPRSRYPPRAGQKPRPAGVLSLADSPRHI